jgi:mono/diheme cytochrome c family protein
MAVRIRRRIIIALGGLVILLMLAIAAVYLMSENIYNREYLNHHIPVDVIPIPTDRTSVSRGEHLATIFLCRQCHGENLGGAIFPVPVEIAKLAAPNLTSGAGGIGATNTDDDWVRAIRHGVGHDGRGLGGMPSRVFYYLGDQDLGALIAYLKSLPPVDNELPAKSIGPLGRLALVLRQFPQPEVAVIDHDGPRPLVPEPGVSVEYGQYVARSCTLCHGVRLNGGYIRSPDGKLLLAPNLTLGGALAFWSEDEFITTLRTGVTPGGSRFRVMPWQYLGRMADEEMRAVWLFLKSLSALEQGQSRTDM